MFKDTKHKYGTCRITWKNGKPINWNSHKLTLSKMIPNGIDTTFCKSKLHDMECALREFLEPFYGCTEWKQNAPIVAVMVSEYLTFVDMITTCYSYDSMHLVRKGGKYYTDYARDLLEANVPYKVVEKEFDTLLEIMVKYCKEQCSVKRGVHTDFEGCVYNSSTENVVELNVIIKKNVEE